MQKSKLNEYNFKVHDLLSNTAFIFVGVCVCVYEQKHETKKTEALICLRHDTVQRIRRSGEVRGRGRRGMVGRMLLGEAYITVLHVVPTTLPPRLDRVAGRVNNRFYLAVAEVVSLCTVVPDILRASNNGREGKKGIRCRNRGREVAI